jgi:hypothetical protein
LYVVGNIEAGEMSGTASIDYERDGCWSVDAIYLDGWDKTTRQFNTTIKVPTDSEVYRVLHERLTSGRTADFIGSEVWASIERDREPDPDYRRDLRMERV